MRDTGTMVEGSGCSSERYGAGNTYAKKPTMNNLIKSMAKIKFKNNK